MDVFTTAGGDESAAELRVPIRRMERRVTRLGAAVRVAIAVIRLAESGLGTPPHPRKHAQAAAPTARRPLPRGVEEALAPRTHPPEPGLRLNLIALFLVRKGGSHGNGDLTGTYHLGSFSYDSDVARDDSAWGSMTLGGDGMASGNVQFNIDGSVISPVSTSLPPGVASGGTVTATFATLEFTGTVLAGGELIILAGSTTSTEAPMLLALIRGQPAQRQPSWTVCTKTSVSKHASPLPPADLDRLDR